jgi:hypothetical protein
MFGVVTFISTQKQYNDKPIFAILVSFHISDKCMYPVALDLGVVLRLQKTG